MDRQEAIDNLNRIYGELHRFFDNYFDQEELDMMNDMLSSFEKLLDRIDPQ